MGISTVGVVVAVDVGYGNCKLVGGEVSRAAVHEVVLPSGAAPVDAMPRQHDRPDLMGGELVLVDGAEWVAGVEPLHIQNRVRKTHAAYTREKEYEALFKAALARHRHDHIDLLVTGIPVSQFYGPDSESLRAGLVSLMRGRKQITAHRTVTVDHVIVVPQPFGSFMAMAVHPDHTYLQDDPSLFGLVVDPGFGTVDMVGMTGQSISHQHSDSSPLATSHVLELAAAQIARTLGVPITSDRLDMALRSGRSRLLVGREEVDLAPILAPISQEVGRDVAALIQRKLRKIERAVDYIILTGGGASLYAPSLVDAFPASRILTPDDPVLANARGYHVFGKLKLQTARGYAPAA